MRSLVYSLFGLGLVAVGWFSASAKPPGTLNNTPAFERSNHLREVTSSRKATNEPSPLSLVSIEPQKSDRALDERRRAAMDYYLQLSEEFGDLLATHELIAESAALEKKIPLKRSELSLHAVRQILEEIIEQHPSTPSAIRAQRMLEQFDAPTSEPTLPSNK